MRYQELLDLSEAYQLIYEQQIGVPIPPGKTAGDVIRELLPKSERNKVIDPDEPAKQSKLQKAHYEPQGEIIDTYDEVLEYLLGEGYSEKESNQIMVAIIENQMHPQEVIGRGIANMLGLDRPNPTQVFARAFKSAFMNKPKTVQAPTPPGPPKVSASTKPPETSLKPKPNPYRPGATVRATGPGMDRYPELRRFTDQGRRPVPTPRSGQGISIPGVGGRLGAFTAGMQAYNTADATPKTAPKVPTTAKEVKKGETYYDPSTRVGPSQRFAQREKVGPKIVGTGPQSFDSAYKSAKEKGGMGSSFDWKGNKYKVY